jgi:tight adherence protein B
MVTQSKGQQQQSTTSSIFETLSGMRGGTSAQKRDAQREFAEKLDRAGISQNPAQVYAITAGGAVFLWLFLVALMKPGMVISIVLLPLCGVAAVFGLRAIIGMKTAKRLDTFVTQLEVALRLISSGVRIGLGLRQALAMVIDEMPDPARYEFLRVIGQTNIGVSAYDALDTLAARMPSHETRMMSRAIRIQAQTGGDLGKILEHLANTIKERRRIQRKIRALTAEGRSSAGILSAIPPFLAGFISLAEPSMGHALFFTMPGHIALGIVAVMEACGTYWLFSMLKVDV